MAFIEPKETDVTIWKLPEVRTMRGANNVADVGTGTLAELIGDEWLLVLQNDTDALELYKWSGTDWIYNQTFSTTAGNKRYIGGAFDQSAHVHYGYEIANTIYIHRALPDGTYLEVSFQGKNPVFLFDAIVTKSIADSDVVVFYQKTANLDNISKLYYRLQRQGFAIENEINLGTDLVGTESLVTVTPAFLRWQARYVDSAGTIINPVESAMYPYMVELNALEGTGTLSAYLRDIVTQYNLNLNAIEGTGTLSAIIESIVTTYGTVSLDALEGTGQLSAIIKDIVTTYGTTNLNALEGTGTLSAVITEIVTQYSLNLNALEGTGTLSAVIDTP